MGFWLFVIHCNSAFILSKVTAELGKVTIQTDIVNSNEFSLYFTLFSCSFESEQWQFVWTNFKGKSLLQTSFLHDLSNEKYSIKSTFDQHTFFDHVGPDIDIKFE